MMILYHDSGKWQYEIMLGTKGVMQVGWATMNCKFSEEKGVGKSSLSTVL